MKRVFLNKKLLSYTSGYNQLLQPCTARTVWSDSVIRPVWLVVDQVIESTELIYVTSHELEGEYY